jgi:hypothetical protein
MKFPQASNGAVFTPEDLVGEAFLAGKEQD